MKVGAKMRNGSNALIMAAKQGECAQHCATRPGPSAALTRVHLARHPLK
jgi:hypothetical protein